MITCANPNTLHDTDLAAAVRAIDGRLFDIMVSPEWHNRIFIAGGVLRAVVANEKIEDIDLFVCDTPSVYQLAAALTGVSWKDLCNSFTAHGIVETKHALTIRGKSGPAIQIIKHWTFSTPQAAIDSFDFSICCAAIWFGATPELPNDLRWRSVCHEDFYHDVADKRLNYRQPVRDENAAGSLLRVLKFTQRGYRISAESLAAVVGRLLARYSPTLEYTIDERHATEAVLKLFVSDETKRTQYVGTSKY